MRLILVDLAIALFALSPLPALFWEGPWLGLTPFIALVLFPILDFLIPKAFFQSSVRKSPSFLLTFYLPYHAALILFAAFSVRSNSIQDLEFWAKAFSVGLITGGVGITFAHEWVHRLKRSESLRGEWLLLWVSYAHYATEHVYGHHKWVATPLDPATARRGEWLQFYIFRSVPRAFLAALKKKPLKTLFQLLLSLGILFSIGTLWGEVAGFFFLAQSAFAVLLLVSIDYVEHYGLERRKNGDRYESIKPWHSWDSESPWMGEILIRLQRHSDHHLRPLKPYPELALLPDAPRLPTGYAGMVWLAWWPLLWRRVMDPRLDSIKSRLESGTTK